MKSATIIIILLTNQITIPKNQALIQKLDQYGRVFIYQDTKENEILDYTGYVTNHLFDSSHTKSDLNILIKS